MKQKKEGKKVSKIRLEQQEVPAVVEEQGQLEQPGQSGPPVETGEEGEEDDGPRKPRKTFEHQYRDFRLILELSTTDTQLINYATQYGYPPERIAEGSTLFDELTAAREVQKDKQAAWQSLHKAFKEKERIADETQLQYRQVCRLAFKENNAMQDTLGLKSDITKTFSERVVQQTRFFQKILTTPGAVEELAKYNATLEQLESAMATITAVVTADTARMDAKADAQLATEEKNYQFKRLSTWIALYLKIMRAALWEKPQLLEKLGIVVPAQI